MFRNSFVLVLAAVLGSVSVARADVGPKPRERAQGMEARPGDMPGVGIEMTSEEVSLKLIVAEKKEHPKDLPHEDLVVEARFRMTNLGEAVEIEEGFPVGPVMNMEAFSVELDGRKVDSDLVDLASGKKIEPDQKRDGEGYHDYWYVWKASYRAKASCVHVVKYTVKNYCPVERMMDTGYVLHTGAPWTNAIGRAKVTFRVEGMSLDHVYSVFPRRGLKRDGDALTWEFEDIEPSEDDDIRIRYLHGKTWVKAVEDCKRGKNNWSARQQLADLLEASAFHAKRTEMTDEQHAEYAQVLASLFSEVYEQDGRWILPYTGGGGSDGADGLFRFLRNACDAVKARPGEPVARRMLMDFVALAERFQKGKLYVLYADSLQLGGSPVELEFGKWREGDGMHEAKARKRLEENLSLARGLLGTK